MTKHKVITYQLPKDRGTITVSMDPKTWPKPGEIGYVPREAVFPDPEQHRRLFYKPGLMELGRSIRANGQVEAAVVSRVVDMPWYKKPVPAGAGAMIVSGDRRWKACGIECSDPKDPSEVPVFLVRVETYASYEELFDFGVLLNREREDVNPVDLGYALKRQYDRDPRQETIEKLARDYCRSITWVLQRKGLTNLSPALQALMGPEVPHAKKLILGPAVLLSQIAAHKRQEMLYNGMCVLQGNAAEKLLWLKNQITGHGQINAVRSLGEMTPAREQQPTPAPAVAHRFSRRPDRNRSSLRVAVARAASDFRRFLAMSDQEWRHTFGSSPEEHAQCLELAEGCLEPLGKLLERLKKASSKKAGRPAATSVTAPQRTAAR